MSKRVSLQEKPKKKQENFGECVLEENSGAEATSLRFADIPGKGKNIKKTRGNGFPRADHLVRSESGD